MYLNLNGQNVERGIDGTITISPPTSRDTGFYQCIAKNQFGTALSNTSFMQMAIIENKGSRQVWSKTVIEGESFCIEAQPMRSIPKATPTWVMADNHVDQVPVQITLTKRMQIAENGKLF